MARRCTFRICKLCAVPHGKQPCPLHDLNEAQELEQTMKNSDLTSIGLTPALEKQIRALRREWKKDHAPIVVTPRVDVVTAADRLRQAWGIA
jgi:hypothetical protein